MKIVKILMLLLIVLMISVTQVSAKTFELSMSETKEKTITNFTVHVPVIGDFKIFVKMKTETKGELTVDISVNRQKVSPGENVEISVKPIKGQLTIVRTPIVEVIGPDGKVYREELESIKDTKDIPGEFSVSIPIPVDAIIKAVLSYYTGGLGGLLIPSVGATVSGTVKTYPILYIKTEGLYPDMKEITLYSKQPVTVKVEKVEGVGGKIILDSWNLNCKIQTSAEVTGEYEGNITPVSYKLVDKKVSVNKVIATLKTPVQITVNEIGSTKVGEKTLISGTVNPPASIELKIICDGKIIGTVKSSSDGKFDFIWIPKDSGKFFIKVVHEGSEFTLPAESNVVTVEVSKGVSEVKTPIKTPAKPVETVTPVATPTQVPTTPREVIPIPTKAPGFEVIGALAACVVALALKRKIM